MLYSLCLYLSEKWHFLNIFQYITFRTGGALLSALIFSFCFGAPSIRWLKSRQKEGQPIRKEGPASHHITKKGTPTMGGLLILISLILSTLFWADLSNGYIWTALFVTVAFGLLGAHDDYLKLSKNTNHGVSSRYKFGIQLLFAGVAILVICYMLLPEGDNPFLLFLPFTKTSFIDLGLFYPVFGLVVIVGASNAVNLTDGLDGLAIGPIIITILSLGVLAYVVGHYGFAHYLHVPFIPKVGELSVICGALAGAGLGFLWFNAPPAQVFMGDTGSLSIGALMGTIAVMIKHELVLGIIGGLFVAETLSVIIQVFVFKVTKGKRVFLMAPLHHHFEKKGWSEPTIVMRFWIISLVLSLIGLASLKVR